MSLLRVQTESGIALGTQREGSARFLGIPYGKAARFAPPEKADKWEGERLFDAFGLSPICHSFGPDRGIVKGEDCLNLNIWTPAETAGDKKPVMLWIYGGGFQNGTSASPEFDGEELARHGVVSVSINYRVGALGYFAHPALKSRSPYGTTGNYGTYDQIRALEWVRDNIAAFGGDPENVMIFGQSAGGISCRILLTSPMAKGLVRRASVQSGGGLNEADPVRSMDELADYGVRTMEKLGWTVDDLFTRSAEEVNDALCDTVKTFFTGKVLGVFQPCVDGVAITQVPGVAISRGEWPEDVDVICGTVKGDSWMFCRSVCAQLGEDDDTLRGFSYSPSQSWARTANALGKKPIHTYYLERKQKANRHFGGDGIYRYGLDCPHSSEIPYVFGTLDKKHSEFEDLDRKLSRLMVAYWTNFARTGDPNGEGLPRWPAYTAEEPVSLHLSDEGAAVENIVTTEKGERVIAFTMEHPGMLESLEGFQK